MPLCVQLIHPFVFQPGEGVLQSVCEHGIHFPATRVTRLFPSCVESAAGAFPRGDRRHLWFVRICRGEFSHSVVADGYVAVGGGFALGLCFDDGIFFNYIVSPGTPRSVAPQRTNCHE
jgi:hypothetical protein